MATRIALMLFLMAQGLDAQVLPRVPEAEEKGPPAGYIDIAGLASNALGEFGDLVGAGGGVNLSAKVFPIEDFRNVRLRADLGFVIYGSETIPTCLTDPCRVVAEIETTNNIFYMGLGPEIVLAQGRLEPYVYGTVGGSIFNTESGLKEMGDSERHFKTSHLTDWIFAWRAGGGVRLVISEYYLVDFGVEHHGNGVANYLTKGDVIDNPDGKVSINPRRSEANLLTFRLGMSFGIGSHIWR